MKFLTSTLVLTSLPLLLISCTAPPAPGGGTGAGGTYQDPNNPYAVPGVSTQGGGYAPTAQIPSQVPASNSAPYQPIPSTPINPPAAPYNPPPAPSAPVASSGGAHTVASGDTLWGLSRKYGVSVDEIRQANGLTSDVIVTGQSLSIPR